MRTREWRILEVLQDGQPATLGEIRDRLEGCDCVPGDSDCVPKNQVSSALSQAKGCGNVHRDEDGTRRITKQGRMILSGKLPALRQCERCNRHTPEIDA